MSELISEAVHRRDSQLSDSQRDTKQKQRQYLEEKKEKQDVLDALGQQGLDFFQSWQRFCYDPDTEFLLIGYHKSNKIFVDVVIPDDVWLVGKRKKRLRVIFERPKLISDYDGGKTIGLGTRKLKSRLTI